MEKSLLKKYFTKLNRVLVDVPTASKISILGASLAYVLKTQANNEVKLEALRVVSSLIDLEENE